MSVHTHFDNAVIFLVRTVMHYQPYGFIRHPEAVMDAYDAIEFIGEYMGRYDIFKLADLKHVILGDTPPLDDIVWVLAEVQKFRATQPPVRWYTKLLRWWAYQWRAKKFRYHRG